MTCSRSMLGSLCFHYQHFGSPGHICHEPTWAVHVFPGTQNCHLECAEGMVQVQSRQGSTLRTVQAFTDGDIAHTSARGFCLRPFKYAPRWYSVAISIRIIYRVINFKLTTSTTIDSFDWLSRFEQLQKRLLPQRQDSISASYGQMAVAQRTDPLVQVERSEGLVIQDLRMAPGAPIEAGWPDSGKTINNCPWNLQSTMAWKEVR